MPLQEYKPKLETITFDGGEFTVRGISLPDVALLIDMHEGTISTIVELAQSRAEMFNSGDDGLVREAMTDLISSLIRESSILMSNLIAILADEPGTLDQASKLPITVQLEALTRIAELTFRDPASVKKLAADVMRLIRGMVPIAISAAAE